MPTTKDRTPRKAKTTRPTAAMKKTIARAEGSERCVRGHALDADNVIVWRSAPKALRCRECYALKRGEQAARRKAQAAAKARKARKAAA